MNENLLKLFAAYQSGLLQSDVVSAYYPILSRAFLALKKQTFTAGEVVASVEKLFGVQLPVEVVRTILIVGQKNRELGFKHGVYQIRDVTIFRKSGIEAEFYDGFDKVVSSFLEYCKVNGFFVGAADRVKNQIIESLNLIDADVITDGLKKLGHPVGTFTYAWCCFIEYCKENDSEVFDFVSRLCVSNIMLASLVYMPSQNCRFTNLSVYFDSPIVYSLLGLSDDPITENYKKLLGNLQSLDCRVCVLDRHWNEVMHSLYSTMAWTYSAKYTFLTASPLARSMKKKWKTYEECDAAIGDVEQRLHELGISIKRTAYNRQEDEYQIDEKSLRETLSHLYQSRGSRHGDMQRWIETDATAVSMLYRMRHGATATRIEYANHLIITNNNALVKACKVVDRRIIGRGRKSTAIPVCLHSDVMSTLAWLSKPEEAQCFRKEKLLAICYDGKMPRKEILDAFALKLEEAHNMKKVTDDEYVFLRRGAMVECAIMHVVKGRDSCDDIVQRVIDEIKTSALHKFSATKEELEGQIQAAQEEKFRLSEENRRLLEDGHIREKQIEKLSGRFVCILFNLLLFSILAIVFFMTHSVYVRLLLVLTYLIVAWRSFVVDSLVYCMLRKLKKVIMEGV